MKVAIILIVFIVYFKWVNPDNPQASSVNSDIDSCFYEFDNILGLDTIKIQKLRGSIYHPSISQTDSTPLETASMLKIDTVALKFKKIKWVAISRNLHKNWKGKYHFKDTLYIFCAKQPALNGYWIITDVMNKRYKNSIDFLMHKKAIKLDTFNNIIVTHFPKKKRK